MSILGWIHLYRREFDLAEQYYQRALDLNPNDPEQIAYVGVLKTVLGEPDQALAGLEQARLLDPFFGPSWYWPLQGMAHFIGHHTNRPFPRRAGRPQCPCGSRLAWLWRMRLQARSGNPGSLPRRCLGMRRHSRHPVSSARSRTAALRTAKP
ncbi:tetratricopeptide repeat protein [Microvirga brassicacearum]|uniref:tetratricopeptide repeat protein n=1 Tax=Microvirga brassicacearum TaxID=2580413 RepID=UPI0013911E1A